MKEREEEILKNLQVRIGRKIEELRRAKGYTSHESFAYDFDIPRMQYWRIENGKTNLTLKSLVKVLRVHEISVEDFFCGLMK